MKKMNITPKVSCVMPQIEDVGIERKTQVVRQLELLEKGIMQLRERCEKLTILLSPVLQPPAPVLDDSCAKECEQLVPLADSIASSVFAIKYIDDTISDILTRIEL